MYNLETPKSFEDFVLTTRKAANNFEMAFKQRVPHMAEFVEEWKVTVRDAYAMILANNVNGTVKLPEGYTVDTIEGEPQLDYAINIFNNFNLGTNIMWMALNEAIEGKKEYEFIYKYYEFLLNNNYEFEKQDA